MKGIDISKYQGTNINFAKVKAAGIEFVMLKATEGVNYTDPCFKTNAAAAISAGLPIGVYHFLRAGSAADQARDCLTAIKPYKITWPVAVDVENPSKGTELSDLGRDKLTTLALDFCSRIKAAGYQPMIYASYNWLYGAKLLDIARIKAANIPIWMAWYSSAAPDNTDRSALCDIWQYASDGKVDGITSSGLDVNVSYKDFGAKPYTCDTSGTVEIAPGGCYTAKTTGNITLVPGTAGVVQIVRCIQRGYTLWHIVPLGKSGQDVGIYPQGDKQKLFRVTIK
jgi:lysozyme